MAKKKKEKTSKEVAANADVLLNKSVTKDISPAKVRRPMSLDSISHNPALIEWPTDIWGLTKDLKKEFLKAASRINGQADKKALLDSTLAIAHAHLESKFKKDASILDARAKKEMAEEKAAEQLKLF